MNIIKSSKYKLWMVVILAIALCRCANTSIDQQANSTPIVVDEESLKTLILNTTTLSNTTAIKKIDTVLEAVKKDSAAFCTTASYLKKFYSNPNSPYRNENLTKHLLESMIESPHIGSTEKAMFQKQLNLAKQNQVGQPANDFTFINTANQKQSLYSLASPYTIIFFNNPDCPACKEYKTAFNQSAIISRNLKNKKLQILSMYIDKDLDLWKKHTKDFPSSWIVAHDEGEFLFKNDRYNLHAIPTIYLLDKDKRVLLKDCMSIPEIEQYLQ